MNLENRYIPIKEVSERLGYCPATVRRMVKEQRLSAIRPGGPRGHLRIPESEILGLQQRCAAEAKADSLQQVIRRRARAQGLLPNDRKTIGSLFGAILSASR